MDSSNSPVAHSWGRFGPKPRYGLDVWRWQHYLQSAVTIRHWFALDDLAKKCAKINTLCTEPADRNPYRDPDVVAAAHTLIQMSEAPGPEALASAPPPQPAKKRRGRPPKNVNLATLRPTTASSNETDSRPKPKLKLNFKKAAPTPRKLVADDTDGDTIAVSHKSKLVLVPDADESPLSDLEMLYRQVDNGIQISGNTTANRPWGRTGKQRVRDDLPASLTIATNSHDDQDVDMFERVLRS